MHPETTRGRVMHISVNHLIIIGSDNGLSPGRRQAFIWTNDGISLIGHLGINFREILIEIQPFSVTKLYLKMPSTKWRLFRLSLNVFNTVHAATHDIRFVVLCSDLILTDDIGFNHEVLGLAETPARGTGFSRQNTEGYALGVLTLKASPSGYALGVLTPKASPSGWVFSQAQHPMIKTYNSMSLHCNTAVTVFKLLAIVE